MVRWTREPRFYAVVPIGKHKGASWDACPADYLQWMCRQPDMEADLKAAAQGELNGRGGV